MGESNEVSFAEEMPFPESNLAIYRDTYVAEQWLRRIAYAAVLAKHGRMWWGILPSEFYRELKSRLASLEGRVHLDCENSSNAIWLLTLEELKRLMTMKSVWSIVKSLTRYKRKLISSKIDDLREIRNVVGHHRAVTNQTLTICRGISTSLRSGIDTFKSKLLYGEGGMTVLDHDEEDSTATYFRWRTRNDDWGESQRMLSESEYFYSLTRLPTQPFGRCVRVSSILDVYRSSRQGILAILVNKTGDEFSVTWPKNESEDDHRCSVDSFLECAESIWTDTDYMNQSSKFICDPMIWFYENRKPLRE